MFRFENIYTFYFLSVLVLIIVLFYLYNKWRINKIKLFADNHLLKYLIIEMSENNHLIKFALSIIIFILFIFSIANFQFTGELKEQLNLNKIEMILAIDISSSMQCDDVKPSRIERAKMFCKDLIDKSKNAKTGIVLFAGDAYILMPITSDPDATSMFISSISTDLMSFQGTAIDKALTVSAQAFMNSCSKSKIVVLISDGENFSDDVHDKSKNAFQDGIIINTVSFGMPEGGTIPIKNISNTIEFKKDSKGDNVITKPDFKLLSDIASNAGGISVDGNNQSKSIESILNVLEKNERSLNEGDNEDRWKSLFYIFAVPALVLLIIDFFITERKMKWQVFHYSKLKIRLTKK